MAAVQVTEFSIEKLDPPTTVAGKTAQLANVTRTYLVDAAKGTKTLRSVDSIEIEWGVLVADKIQDLLAEKASIQLEANAKIAKLDKSALDLSLAIALPDEVIKP